MKKVIVRATGVYLNTLSRVSPELAGKHGFRIFCFPRRLQFKKHHLSFLDTAERFHFHHRNFCIQGYKWGVGHKRVLFLHGWQSHSFRWKKYIEALPQNEYTIYSIDAPGHGASGGNMLHVPLYSEVITELISKFGEFDAVIGHSMGGFSILHALHHKPDLVVAKLVLMAAPGEGTDFVSYFKQLLGLSDRAVSLTLDYFEKLYGKPMSYFSTQRFASGLSIPGLIIHDIYDEEAPYRYAVKVSEVWERGFLLSTRGLGHNLKSPEVVSAVKEFILFQRVSKENITLTQPEKQLQGS